MSAHTPGPWLAAARPSSVVGWPVVAPHAMGRSVASVTHAALILDGDRATVDAFNAQSEANARLIALAPEMADLLAEGVKDMKTMERVRWKERAAALLAKAEGL